MASGSFSGYVCGTAERPGYKLITSWASEKNIAGNYSTVTCTHTLECGSGGWGLDIGSRSNKCIVGDDEKSFSSSGIHTGGGTTHDLGTTVHKIPHDSQGRKTVTATSTFNMQASISGVWRESITATGTMVLDDIPRASTMTAPDGTLDTAMKFSVSQADASFYHVITYTCGNVKDSVAVSKTQNTAPTWTPPLSLASQSPGLSKVSVIFTITTYSGDTPIGTSTATAEYIIPANSVKPGISLSVSDVTNYKTTYGNYVQGKSKFKVTVTGTPSYNSPIKTYSTTINGGTPYTEKSFETDLIKDAGTYNIVSTITDERSNSNTATTPVTVLEYHEPIVEFSVTRCDENWLDNLEGKYVRIDWFATVSNLGGKNKLSVDIKYNKTGSSDYITIHEYENEPMGDSLGIGSRFLWDDLDENSSYDFEIIVTDNLSTTKKYVSVPSVFVFFHFDGPTTDGVGRNKLNTVDPPFDVGSNNDPHFGYSFAGNALTLEYSGSSSIYIPMVYVIPDVKKGDVIRFKSKMSNANAFAKLTLITNKAGADNVLINELDKEFNYTTDNHDISFEYTVLNDIFMCHVTLGLKHNSGQSGPISTQFIYPIVTINDKDTSYEQYLVGVEPSLGIGKMAELPNGVDFGLKAKFNKGFVAPTLTPGTDLNSITEPNFYASGDTGTYNYKNCPVTSGTFHLEVISAGDTGQLLQRVKMCTKDTDTNEYTRYYYSNSWGSWVRSFNKSDVSSAPSTSDIAKALYPVGSIYMSVKDTDPKTLFPGTTWERLKDRFLLGAGDTYAAGGTGGAATHKLTINEMPKHGHPENYAGAGGDTNRAVTPSTGGSTSSDNIHGTYQGSYMAAQNAWSSTYRTIVGTGLIGGDAAHNNMPPYLTVYMWKRTA